jgi:hypothetical protein
MGIRAQHLSGGITTAIPDDEISLDDILSLEAFTKRYPDIANEARLRWWVFHRQTNGLAEEGALIKRNGRWFFIVPRMKTWMLHSTQAA